MRGGVNIRGVERFELWGRGAPRLAREGVLVVALLEHRVRLRDERLLRDVLHGVRHERGDAADHLREHGERAAGQNILRFTGNYLQYSSLDWHIEKCTVLQPNVYSH